MFVAEGKKTVAEILNSSLKVNTLYHLKEFQISSLVSGIEIDERELKKISFLETPNEALCLVEIPRYKINLKEISEKISIFLDNIKDPGNLGNIIRIADWFGIENIFCSPECVDAYNPKVVQASMGSIARVKIHESVKEMVRKMRITDSEFPIYATTLDGKNIYEEKLSKNGLLIFGNESSGISKEILELAGKKISIPRFGRAESLNVAASVAIICSEFMRR